MKLLTMGGYEPAVIAVGPQAFGVFAFGQDARGVFAFGQLATGVIAFGQVATGVVAVGQLARGGVAIGQGAIGLVAGGQVAVGVLWVTGLGIGGTAGPLAVYGLFGRFRMRRLRDAAERLRLRGKRARNRVRGGVQDAIPLSALVDRRPWSAGRVVGLGARIVGFVAITVLWWIVAGQAMVDGAVG